MLKYQKTRISLKELNIQHKQPIGAGWEHTVFPYSKFVDKVIKTKTANLELSPDGKSFKVMNRNEPLNQSEMEVFKSHPDIFAKVYKLTPRYAVIEKLNTTNITKDIEELSYDFLRFLVNVDKKIQRSIMNKLGWVKDPRNMTPDYFNFLAILKTNYDNGTFLRNLYPYIRDKEFFKKLIQFLQKVQSANLNKKSIDIHDENVGYDKQGNIKLLDF